MATRFRNAPKPRIVATDRGVGFFSTPTRRSRKSTRQLCVANTCVRFKVTTPGPSPESWQISCFTRLLSHGCAPSYRRRCRANHGRNRAGSTTRACGALRRPSTPSATSPAYAQSSLLALLRSSHARVTRSASEGAKFRSCACPHSGQQMRPRALRRGENANACAAQRVHRVAWAFMTSWCSAMPRAFLQIYSATACLGIRCFSVTHCPTDRTRIESATLTCLSQSGKGWYFPLLRPSGVPKQVCTVMLSPSSSLPAGSSRTWIRGARRGAYLAHLATSSGSGLVVHPLRFDVARDRDVRNKSREKGTERLRGQGQRRPQHNSRTGNSEAPTKILEGKGCTFRKRVVPVSGPSNSIK